MARQRSLFPVIRKGEKQWHPTPEERSAIQKEVFEIAEVHPITIPDILDLELIPNRRTATDWVAKWRDDELLRHVGYVRKGRRGRIDWLYCNGWEPRHRNERHEHELTKACLLFYGDANFQRGPFVDKRLADAEMWLGDYHCYLEMFCGTQSREQWKKRIKAYRQTDKDIRIIISSKKGDDDEWLERLKTWSEDIYAKAFFTTLTLLIEEGAYAPVWDYYEDGMWCENALTEPAIEGDLAQVIL